MSEDVNREEEKYVKRYHRFKGKTPEEVFNEVYDTQDWTSEESVSGFGSTLEYTKEIRDKFPTICRNYNINRVLDLACGDFNWMKELAEGLEFYKGYDIVERLIERNKQKYEVPGKIEFGVGDITKQILVDNRYDAIILRDVLVHFPNEGVKRVLYKLRNAGVKYVFLTHFNQLPYNVDIDVFGQWRAINFTLPPWHFPPPLESIGSTEKYHISINKKAVELQDKTLSLWELNSILQTLVYED